jgi:hypothetical protein
MSNTASLTALPPPRLNTSDAVNYLLTRHGIRVAESTMKQWAWRGGGPEFQKSGPHRLYPVERLNVWAEQRLTPVVASTSELTSLLTIGRDPVLVQEPAHVALATIARKPVQEAAHVAATPCALPAPPGCRSIPKRTSAPRPLPSPETGPVRSRPSTTATERRT